MLYQKMEENTTLQRKLDQAQLQQAVMLSQAMQQPQTVYQQQPLSVLQQLMLAQPSCLPGVPKPELLLQQQRPMVPNFLSKPQFN
jgi:hypothetical protein